jgi:hypothetical protein
MLNDCLISFLLSLTKEQSFIVLGKPTIDFNDIDRTLSSSSVSTIVSSLSKKEYRSKGYLDSYYSSSSATSSTSDGKVSSLLQKMIYYYSNIDKDYNKMIDYSSLLGNYHDILYYYCSELQKYWILENITLEKGNVSSSSSSVGQRNIYNLTGEELEALSMSNNGGGGGGGGLTGLNPLLLQKRYQRDLWKMKSEQFMKFLITLSNSLKSNNEGNNYRNAAGGGGDNQILFLFNISNDIFNNFYNMLILYQMIEEMYCSNDYHKAMLLLEMNGLFPSIDSSSSVGGTGGGNNMDGMIFFLNPVLKHIIDDLLLLIMKGLYEFMKSYHMMSSRGLGLNEEDDRRNGRSIDWEGEYNRMERRYITLQEFLNKYKDQLMKKNILLQENQKLQSFMTIH